MGKFSFVVGFGAGYVVGARAGRQQFEKIKSASEQVWQNPRVQSSVQRVEQKVAQTAKEQASAVTDKVARSVKSRINGEDDDSHTPPRPTPPQPEL